MKKNKYPIKYKTFSTLVADASVDFKKYQMNDLIDEQELLKVAKECNYKLGLKIHKTKDVILEVEKGKVRLPYDFYILNLLFACNNYETKVFYPQGTHVEERIIGQVAPEYQNAPPETIDLCENIIVTPEEPCNACGQCGEVSCEPCNACCSNPSSCSVTCNNDVVQLVQVLRSQTRKFNVMAPVRLKSNSSIDDCYNFNLGYEQGITGVIENGWIKDLSFQTGFLYLNYEGALLNEDNEVLVPDHDGLNPYYEYSLKQRIIENLIMNDLEKNVSKLQLIEARLRDAKNFAMSLVNTPDFDDLRDVYRANRNAMYSKYYDMFKSNPRFRTR